MRTHVRIVAVLFLAFGALCLVGALFSSALLSALAAIVGASGEEHAEVGVAILGIAGIALSVLLVAFGIPAVITGIGLWQLRPWARVMAIILAAIALTKVPIGTAFGVYALIVLFNKQTIPLFERGPAPG